MGLEAPRAADPVLCRACGSPLPEPFLDLGEQPLSNAFLPPSELGSERDRRFPLRVRICPACALVQADDAVAAEAIFDADYAYYSSFSETWLRHSRLFAEASIRRFGLGPSSRVIEVASNDGYLLQYFAAAGIEVLGVEPAAGAAAVARERGIPTEIAFFNARTGRAIAESGRRADLVHGANVLAHVPDLRDFLGGFDPVLKPGGTLTLEFPHLLELLAHIQFDTIYHEHFSYLSLAAVERALLASGFAVYDLERLTTHGGSLRLYCARAADGRPESASVEEVRAAEAAAAIEEPETFARFGDEVARVRADMLAFVDGARAAGRRIAAYGAAAKGNTFLNTCGLTAADVVCAFDRNPHKHGKLMPGSHVPVLPPEQIDAVRPDYVLILPWNLRDEIRAQLAGIAAWGGRFVVAVPRIEVFDP